MIKALNDALSTQITFYKESDIITSNLKALLMELILFRSQLQKYDNITDVIRIQCEARAYVECCKNCIYFNPKESNSAISFIANIIDNAFARELMKNYSEPINSKY